MLQYPLHEGMRRWVADLNRVYREQPALHERDFSADGFAWVDCQNWEESVISYLRYAENRGDAVLVVCNFTPVPRYDYVVGVPHGGRWDELLNSDAQLYGGSGMGNAGGTEAAPIPAQRHFHSLALTLPPSSVLMLKPTRRGEGS